MFIPIEWVSLAHGRRRDVGLLAVGLAMLSVAALLLSPYFALIGHPTRSIGWPLLILCGASATLACVALFWLIAFLKPRPTTILSVSTDAEDHRVEFWHKPGARANVDTLVERIENLRGRIEDLTAFPVHTSHTWYRLRPLRAVLTKAILICVCLYAPVSFASAHYQQPWLELFLLAPPLYYLARYGIDFLWTLREPKEFRAAVRWYNRGEPARANALLNSVLLEHPSHIDALMLGTYASIELGDFPRAFEHCRALAKTDPELADDFVREVWAIKRMHDRMNAAV